MEAENNKKNILENICIRNIGDLGFMKYFSSIYNKIMGTQSPRITQAHFDEASRLANELRNEWPDEFIISGREYPDLHFKADPTVAGLYRAKLDRNVLYGEDSE